MVRVNIMKKIKILKNPLYIIVFIIPFLFGGFFEFTSCILGAVLLFFALKDSVKISLDPGAIAAACIPLFYLLSVFWAVDKGMAVIGFMKFLPLPLLVLLIIREPEKMEECLNVIPWAGAIMTAISFPLSFFPWAEGHLTVSGRLAGFFEYPNTFALFLLLGLIILATSPKVGFLHLGLSAVLLFGIFQSGSRTVFGLLILSAAIIVFGGANKQVRKITLIVVPVAVLSAALFALATGSFGTIGRFLTSSAAQSSFLGRLLYYRDAMLPIIRNPLGLGYEGYFYTQGTFQTGVYSVRYIHNDFLQILMDIGWIPFLLFTAAVVKTFFKKGASLRKRTLLIAICGHCMLDFSLQYISIFFILLLLFDYEKIKEISYITAKRIMKAIGVLLSALCLYFSVPTFMQYLDKYELAAQIYPFYTESYVCLMTKETDVKTAKLYSDKVMELNESVSQAYTVCALYNFERGDMLSAMENMENAISISPYTLNGYTEYMQMLETGINLYEKAGDTASAEFCRKRLISIPERFDKAIEGTSALGWLINDLPPQLPEEYRSLAEEYKTKLN